MEVVFFCGREGVLLLIHNKTRHWGWGWCQAQAGHGGCRHGGSSPAPHGGCGTQGPCCTLLGLLLCKGSRLGSLTRWEPGLTLPRPRGGQHSTAQPGQGREQRQKPGARAAAQEGLSCCLSAAWAAPLDPSPIGGFLSQRWLLSLDYHP